MNITPLEIRKQEFKKAMRGFDREEVLAFLDMVSMEFENCIRENALLNERVGNADVQLKKYRDIESTLQETLLSAQRAREETITSAKKQAELIIREAEIKASSIVEDGRADISRLTSEFAALKTQKDAFVARFKAVLQGQLELLDQTSFPEESAVIDKSQPDDFTDSDGTSGFVDMDASHSAGDTDL